jgi:Holliday junction DNA helicase RuvB
VRRSASVLGIDITEDALVEIAKRSRGTPRIANRLLRRVRDYSLVHGGQASFDNAQAALELYDVDEWGLDRLDRQVLDVLIGRFGGGPVGLGTLSVSVGEEAETVESVVEPFLVRQGFIVRSPRGRIATPLAWRHLGHEAPTLDDL